MAERTTPALIPESSVALGHANWLEGAYSRENNLPIPPTPLIGREQERARAADLLRQPDTRLLTLYGMGGVGKTRLAVAVAGDLAGDFPDGVYFVPLADITEGGLLLSAISQALELYTLPNETILTILSGHMRDMSALLVLDNFEQLVSAAPILSEILSKCARLKLLVTSRAVLNLRGEREMGVQPLALPPTGAGEGARSLIESSPAVQLFTQRARLVKADFTLDSGNAEVVAEICARLDGLPLAIELAAARVKLLSPRAILARLQKRLQLLTGGAQDLPARQQTLSNTIAWSYNLLDPAEQRLFRLLSVFHGGCTLEAAHEVCDRLAEDDGEYSKLDPLEIATSLTNKSLLRVVDSNDESRLVMLETVREYAGEQLLASGELGLARAAHAHGMCALAEEAQAGLRGSEEARWLDRLEREIGNLRAALEWSITPEEESDAPSMERLETGLRIAGSLTRFWSSRSHLQESITWLQTLLDLTPSLRTEGRDRALRAAGRVAYTLGRVEESRRFYEEGVELARERGDSHAMTLSLMGIGNTAWESEDEAGALRAYEECLEIWTEMDDRLGIASALTNIGLVRMYGGDAAGATRNLEQSVRIYTEEGDQESTAVALNCLGQAYGRAGDYARAEKLVREGLTLNLEIGDQWNITYDLVALAQVACAQREYARGVRLLAAAEAHHDDVFERLERLDRIAYEGCIEEARNALGEGMFNIVWADGLTLSPRQILHGDMVGAPSAPEQILEQAKEVPRIDPGLSTREVEVLALLAEGLSNADIAEKLYLSLYTVQAHLRNVYGKLSVASRTAAIRYAVENGLV